jgi:hypothetical protein
MPFRLPGHFHANQPSTDPGGVIGGSRQEDGINHPYGSVPLFPVRVFQCGHEIRRDHEIRHRRDNSLRRGGRDKHNRWRPAS